MGVCRVGTCSWADEGMVKAWYPRQFRGTRKRLEYYSRHFDTVEVDSTFYALPSIQYCRRWAEETPDDFVFHVKGFGLMTGHSVPPARLPPRLREYDFELTRYGNVKNPPGAMIRESFDLFAEAVEPLREAGKLGALLFQFPPYFTAETPDQLRRNLAWLRRSRELMAGYDLAVEFRHRSWSRPPVRDRVLQLLADENISLVAVDEPQVGQESFPSIVRRTAPIGYVRFHGRNRDTWSGRTESAAERFRYLYSDEELQQWACDIRRLTEETEVTYVMFNNCYADYAPKNAQAMQQILGEIID